MSPIVAKAVAVLAVLLGVIAATWFAARAHYEGQYESLKGQLQGAAAAQDAAVKAQQAKDEQTSKGISYEANKVIGKRDDRIDQLTLQLQHAGRGAVQVCAAPASAAKPNEQPIGPGTGQSNPAAAEPARPAALAGVDPDVLASALTIGIDALKSEQFWRQYARGTGQAP